MMNPGDLVVCVEDLHPWVEIYNLRDGVKVIAPTVGTVYTVRYTKVRPETERQYIALVEIIQPLNPNSGREYLIWASAFRKIVKKDQSFFLGTKAPVDA